MSKSIVLITGASSGIGAAAARYLAQQGFEVILQARGKDKLESIAEEINKLGGKAHAVPCDVSNQEQVNQSAQLIKDSIGLPDIIINNAGAGEWLSIFQTSNAEFDQMMSAPYFAAAYTTNAYAKDMARRGSGHIININSAACYFNFPGALGYSATRWALRGFSESLHEDMKPAGIHVSMIAAGKVDSPYFTNNPVSADRIPKIATSIMPMLTVEQVAKKIHKTILNKKRTVVIPWQMNVSVLTNRWFPGLFTLLMRMTGYKGIKDELKNLM